MDDSLCIFFFFSSRRRHTRYWRDWSSDVCSSDLCCERTDRRSLGQTVPAGRSVAVLPGPGSQLVPWRADPVRNAHWPALFPWRLVLLGPAANGAPPPVAGSGALPGAAPALRDRKSVV